MGHDAFLPDQATSEQPIFSGRRVPFRNRSEAGFDARTAAWVLRLTADARRQVHAEWWLEPNS